MITFNRSIPPNAEALPTTMQEARKQCRVTYTDDDDEIRRYLLASMEQLDGHEGLLGRCLLTQTWEMRLDGWPGGRWDVNRWVGSVPYIDRPTASNDWQQGILRVPLAPIISIDSISYIDTAGATQALSLATLDIDLFGDFARIQPVDSAAWPNLSATVFAPVTVTYTAGYGAATNIPKPIAQAMLLKVARWYDHRFSDFDIAGWAPQEMALLNPYRLRNQWRV